MILQCIWWIKVDFFTSPMNGIMNSSSIPAKCLSKRKLKTNQSMCVRRQTSKSYPFADVLRTKCQKCFITARCCVQTKLQKNKKKIKKINVHKQIACLLACLVRVGCWFHIPQIPAHSQTHNIKMCQVSAKWWIEDRRGSQSHKHRLLLVVVGGCWLQIPL